MLPFRLVYHELYDLHLGAARVSFEEIPVAAGPADSHAVRGGGGLRGAGAGHGRRRPAGARPRSGWPSCARGTLSYQEILRLEIPYSRQMVEAFWLADGRNDSGGAAGAGAAYRVQHRRRISSRVRGARGRVLRDQRHRGGGAAAAEGRRDPQGDGGGLRCASRQRDGGDFRGGPVGVHALHSPVQQLPDARSRLPAWIFTCRTGWGTRSI